MRDRTLLHRRRRRDISGLVRMVHRAGPGSSRHQADLGPQPALGDTWFAAHPAPRWYEPLARLSGGRAEMSPWSATRSSMVQKVVRDAPRLFPRNSEGVQPWSAMVRTNPQIRARGNG